MNGTILGFDKESDEGIIKSDEGVRYKFSSSAFKSGIDALKAGAKVDFEIVDGRAEDIFATNANGLFEKIKTLADSSGGDVVGKIQSLADSTSSDDLRKLVDDDRFKNAPLISFGVACVLTLMPWYSYSSSGWFEAGGSVSGLSNEAGIIGLLAAIAGVIGSYKKFSYTFAFGAVGVIASLLFFIKTWDFSASGSVFGQSFSAGATLWFYLFALTTAVATGLSFLKYYKQ